MYCCRRLLLLASSVTQLSLHLISFPWSRQSATPWTKSPMLYLSPLASSPEVMSLLGWAANNMDFYTCAWWLFAVTCFSKLSVPVLQKLREVGVTLQKWSVKEYNMFLRHVFWSRDWQQWTSLFYNRIPVNCLQNWCMQLLKSKGKNLPVMLNPFLYPCCSTANIHPMIPPIEARGSKEKPKASGIVLMAVYARPWFITT